MRDQSLLAEQERHAVERTLLWLDHVVIQENFCPFAFFPLSKGRVRTVACFESSKIECALFFKEEIVRLVHSSLDELETTLLVLSNEVFSELELLLGFLDDMNVFLEDSGLDEAFQLVGFHPLYQFENEALEARSNYTNRSPYPMIHIIREDSMAKAIMHYGEDKTERIPYDNIRKLELMSDEEFKEKILKYCSYQNLVQRK